LFIFEKNFKQNKIKFYQKNSYSKTSKGKYGVAQNIFPKKKVKLHNLKYFALKKKKNKIEAKKGKSMKWHW